MSLPRLLPLFANLNSCRNFARGTWFSDSNLSEDCARIRRNEDAGVGKTVGLLKVEIVSCVRAPISEFVQDRVNY